MHTLPVLICAKMAWASLESLSREAPDGLRVSFSSKMGQGMSGLYTGVATFWQGSFSARLSPDLWSQHAGRTG